jgi:DNA-binding LacI/PurR family transcriptional regulator
MYFATVCGNVFLMINTTITDIAKKLKISSSTVSRALNNHPDIKQETKDQVKKLAKKLNYSPNPIARSLKTKRTNVIGVIVPEIKHDFFSSAISGIEEVAYHSGYIILVCQSNESLEREIINTNALMHQRVAGLIVSISQNTKNGNHFKEPIDRGIPLVFFDRACSDISTNKVIIDDAQSAFVAVTHLVERGHKKIAHFSGPKTLEICKQRLKGYKDALKKANLPLLKELIKYGDLHEDNGYESMDTLLKENNIPDAIFAVNDPVAIGAFQRIKEAGLKIPEDIAIVGFSNNKITSLVDPPLTTVNQPSFNMGKRAAEILIEMIKNKGFNDYKTIVLDAELIVRGST